MSEPAASAITAPHQPPAQDSLSATLNYKSQTVVKFTPHAFERGAYPAVAIGVILAALAVVGYFLWKADQPRFLGGHLGAVPKEEAAPGTPTPLSATPFLKDEPELISSWTRRHPGLLEISGTRIFPAVLFDFASKGIDVLPGEEEDNLPFPSLLYR